MRPVPCKIGPPETPHDGWSENLGEHRRHERQAYHAEATITVRDGLRERSTHGWIDDLSQGGMRLRLIDETMNVGQFIGLTWRAEKSSPEEADQEMNVQGWVARTAPVGFNGRPHGIIFKRTIDEELRQRRSLPLRLGAAAFAISITAGIVQFARLNLQWFWHMPLLESYCLLVTGYTLLRVTLSLLYREPPNVGYLPTVSVIIAVKNEEHFISAAIHQCFASRYPADRMDVIVVNDGSTDGTGPILDALSKVYSRLKVIHFEKNRGKSRAMASAVSYFRRRYLVCVDSDSLSSPKPSID